jgi:N-(2-amino-2-carboxyethyl)-L-glutamate synthase
LLKKELVDECVHVSDWDCVVGCRQLLQSESLLVGGSSGGVFSAVAKSASRINPGAVCAMIFPDRGERYFDTIFCDEWVLEHWAVLPRPQETITAGANA